MSDNKKTNTTISLTQTQSDMFDFLLTILHHNVHTKVSYVLSCIRNEIKGFIDLPEEISLPDEQLLELAIQRNESNIKSIIGEENYNRLKEQKGEDK